MAETKSDQDEDQSDLEGYSLYISSLLSVMGYSKIEVNIRQSKWEFLEQKENLFLKYNKNEKGCVTSGSSSEGMTGGPYYGGQLSDYDCMKILRNFRVVDNTGEVSEYDDVDTVLVKEIPDEKFHGYVKLVVVKADPEFLQILPVINGQHFLPNTVFTAATDLQQGLSKVITSANPLARHHPSKSSGTHGPAVSLKVSEPQSTLSTLGKMTGKAEEDQLAGFSRPFSPCDIDMVTCIKSNKWPELARNWITRPRSGGWPLNSHIQNIVHSLPTYLAPVGHKGSPDLNLQWRSSFNAVEKSLIKDFNKTQIQCYALLKFFLKDYIKEVEENVLSSYCMKTTMFWVSESVGAERMEPGNLLSIFVNCLRFIRQCLLDGKMPIYFTGTGSAFPSDMSTKEIAKIILEIDNAIQDPVTPLQKCKSFKFPVSVSDGDANNFPKLTVHSVLFAWLEMRCGIIESIHFCVTQDLLWASYVDGEIEENINRYRSLADDAHSLIFCQPLVQILQSCLGFLCLAKVSSSTGMTEGDDCTRIQEAEEMLRKSQGGDVTMCPLRLATFYLNQSKPEQVLDISEVVISKAEQIKTRRSFMESLYKRMFEQFQIVAKIDDIQTLQTFYDLICANYISKAHEEEVLYLRNSCKEAQSFLACPVEAQRSLAFDVTFMLPEASALPNAVKLELHFSRLFEVMCECRGMKMSPLLYAYFLRFLAFEMLGDSTGCEETVLLFQDAVKKEQRFYQARGYNLLARCYALLNRTIEAAKCLVCSLQVDPSRNNVAFGYLMFVYNVLFC
ncbi:uncharacterized protein LOC123530088 [Mercenaria mercenaria]|uniref:uncharacterized protein LOC123530088 n=1 Tax=Mercenaria mercenaria TaxID=6596 RepID=UPI00234EA83B|nr:uncharacterized protein LOC123530088 [Mercenaria mercenaria]